MSRTQKPLMIRASSPRSVLYELAALADQDRARGNPLYKLLCLRKTRPMTEADEKQTLHRFLQNARGVLLWKLEGLSDYDIRRPMTPTGTNLLGLVKHCAGVECGYFGEVMDRPFPHEDDLDWHDDELGGHMYATAAEYCRTRSTRSTTRCSRFSRCASCSPTTPARGRRSWPACCARS